MARIETNRWYGLRRQSLAVYARNAGFDLSIFEDYSKSVQAELRSKTIKEAMREIEWALKDQHFDLNLAKKGVYVISLSNPLTIKYPKKRSQVLYIGRGDIRQRISSHFENKLFDLMRSLSGADFDFDFAVPARPGTRDYYKDVEYQMLEWFNLKFGDQSKRCFPLMNKIKGTKKNNTSDSEWWTKPLKATGARPLWEITPIAANKFKLT
ncbi:MAG: hypothetical protein C4K60_13370 [Ideonella sp. MAG2]|nr:MAG: hypothetical protein C4K60_13370 [Ideonella sp. MAG2]